ncbi:hypothetical protein EMIT074MI3_12073 [Bacillus licheniformis]
MQLHSFIRCKQKSPPYPEGFLLARIRKSLYILGRDQGGDWYEKDCSCADLFSRCIDCCRLSE